MSQRDKWEYFSDVKAFIGYIDQLTLHKPSRYRNMFVQIVACMRQLF